MCARKDIDAVIVATLTITIGYAEALRNGKDVYCEKPVTHLFAEGQGSRKKSPTEGDLPDRLRSDQRFRHCAELVLNGHLGKINKVEVGLPTGRTRPPEFGNEESIPDGLDYDFWCGPSPHIPYRFDRHHQNWRWHMSYGGGQLMDWIGHHNDSAHWGMNLDNTGPIPMKRQALNARRHSPLERPVNYTVRSEYAEGLKS